MEMKKKRRAVVDELINLIKTEPGPESQGRGFVPHVVYMFVSTAFSVIIFCKKKKAILSEGVCGPEIGLNVRYTYYTREAFTETIGQIIRGFTVTSLTLR